MWVCLNDSFLSIVDKDCARNELLVRARRPGDIEKVFSRRVVVTKDTSTDYLYRAVVSRDDVKKALAREVDRITYPNFKSSIPLGERKLHDAYLRVWGTMSTLQETRPYTGAPTFQFDDPLPKNYGKRLGGFARAASMTLVQRSEAARKAARARWDQ